MNAHKNKRFFHVFDRVEIPLPRTEKADYYCDDKGQDIRLNNQAIFHLAIVAPIVGQTGVPWEGAVGSLMIDWEVEYKIPRIENQNQFTVNDIGTFRLERPIIAFDGEVLYYESGAFPETQAMIATIVGIEKGSAPGLTPGSVLFMGRVDIEVDSDEPRWVLFNNLSSAQKLDYNDSVKPLSSQAGGQGTTVKINFTPIGPKIEDQIDNDETTFRTTVEEGGNTVCTGGVQDRRYQANEYLAQYQGLAASTTSGVNEPGSDLVKINPNGEELTLVRNEELIYRRVNTDALIAKFGIDPLTFDGLFGIQFADRPKFLGLLVTAFGWIVKAVSVINTTINIGLKIKRVLEESEESFLNRLQIAPSSIVAGGWAQNLEKQLVVV